MLGSEAVPGTFTPCAQDPSSFLPTDKKAVPAQTPAFILAPNANEYAWRRFGAKTGEVPGGLQRIRKLSICLDVHVHFHLFALQRDEAGTLIRLTNNTGRDQIKSAPVADPDEQGHVEER